MVHKRPLSELSPAYRRKIERGVAKGKAQSIAALGGRRALLIAAVRAEIGEIANYQQTGFVDGDPEALTPHEMVDIFRRELADAERLARDWRPSE